jgi:hypothetical protein
MLIHTDDRAGIAELQLAASDMDALDDPRVALKALHNAAATAA